MVDSVPPRQRRCSALRSARCGVLGRAARWRSARSGRSVSRCSNDIIFKELIDAAAATGLNTLASIDARIISKIVPDPCVEAKAEV